eukprot:g68788.t1
MSLVLDLRALRCSNRTLAGSSGTMSIDTHDERNVASITRGETQGEAARRSQSCEDTGSCSSSSEDRNWKRKRCTEPESTKPQVGALKLAPQPRKRRRKASKNVQQRAKGHEWMVPLNLDESEVARRIALRLREPKRHLIAHIVTFIGKELAVECLRETGKQQRQGGMKLPSEQLGRLNAHRKYEQNRGRNRDRRTPGGAFIAIVRQRIPVEMWKQIQTAVKKEERTRKRGQSATVTKSTAEFIEAPVIRTNSEVQPTSSLATSKPAQEEGEVTSQPSDSSDSDSV